MIKDSEKHIIIGTAGHIDHGKTTLIKALTGTNTDRLKEEQQRGISIELGFGCFNSPNGTKFGIVDVPGHERFINNMVAGVVGMDLILLVIAADEGIMPQTREHLDILSLLGVTKAIVVLNKIDVVDTDWLELVESDIIDELADTFLEKAPIAKVSSLTGKGLDNLISLIEQMTENDVKQRNKDTIPRLPIDRVFTIKGAGTVVTGTLISGTICPGDELEIYPINKPCKIRGVQVHDKAADAAYAGQRTALNLSNIDKEEIYRGCVVAGIDSICATDTIDVRLNVLESSKRVIENYSRLHFFSGTSEVLCRVVLLDAQELCPGQTCLAQLRMEKKIAIQRGDRFVVRFYSPLETIGGGTVIETNVIRGMKYNENDLKSLELRENGTIEETLIFYINNQTEPVLSIAALAKLTAVSNDEVQSAIEAFVKNNLVSVYGVLNETIVWSCENKDKLINKLLYSLKNFHNKYPYKPGMYRAELYRALFAHSKRQVFDAVIDELCENKLVKCNNEYVLLESFSIPKDKTFNKVQEVLLSTLRNAKFNFEWYSDIKFNDIDQEIVDDICRCLLAEGQIVKVAENIFTLPQFIDEAKNKIIDVLKVNKRITIAEVRDMLGTTRKTAKPILEYMDSIGVTKKTGGEAEREAGNLEAVG